MKIGKIVFDDYPVILAPMEDITDGSFRVLCKRFGADLMYTEFISSDGLVRLAGKSMEKLRFDDIERPMGVQVFGSNADAMRRAVEIAEVVQPDLIDINFGCPVKKVVNKGAGAAILRDVPKMIELTTAVVKATRLPVTVKTRLGWDQESKNIVDVAERLQDTGIQALTIHGRTRSQLYSGQADWTLIGEVKNNPRIQIPVIGNGDIDSAARALEYRNRYGVDGIMIGRAAIGNPFLFREVQELFKNGRMTEPAPLHERMAVCLEHLDHSIARKGDYKGVIEMRKHYGGYIRSFRYSKMLRMKLVEARTRDEIVAIFEQALSATGTDQE